VTTLGLTGRQYALDLISSIGTNMVEMQYSGGSIEGPDNTSSPDFMTREDLTAVTEQVSGVVASSPMLEFRDNISIGGGITKNTMFLGVSPQYKAIRNLDTVAGRFFDDQDMLGHTKVVVLVEPFARLLFGSDSAAIDQTISVRGIPLTVIGVFKLHVDVFGQSEVSDQTVLIPYPVARYFTGSDSVKEIFFSVKDSSMVIPASKQILAVIKARHRPSSVYNPFIMTDLIADAAKIADMLIIVLTLAAFVTLVVSGVGIMNSMLANVSARIREIGIRKAMGATSREIRMQFLTEAVFLSLAGGVVGTLLGLALPFSLRFFTPFAIPISIWSAVISLSTSVIVGVVFGTLPANRAARLDPVETLKYE
jgi:putative ABC transport system permease protein